MDLQQALDIIKAQIDLFRRSIVGNELDVIVGLCAATLVLFILVLLALLRGRRLRKQIKELQLLSEGLARAEEARLLKEMRARQEARAAE